MEPLGVLGRKVVLRPVALVACSDAAVSQLGVYEAFGDGVDYNDGVVSRLEDEMAWCVVADARAEDRMA